MKHFSYITALLLLTASGSHAAEATAEEEHIEAHSLDLEEAETNAVTPWSFKLSAEGRVRTETDVNQFITRFDYGYTLNEDFSVFGAVWARHRQQSGYTNNANFLTAGDFMIGLYYDFNAYINPYVFYEMYLDAEHGDWNNYKNAWSGFGSVGVGGTLYSEGKHSISYYAEYYFSLGKQEGGYAGDFPDNFMPYGSEFALKYSYQIYDNTSFYYQPTWYTYADGNIFDKGSLEHRFGISVAF